jgi:hypothetical protein
MVSASVTLTGVTDAEAGVVFVGVLVGAVWLLLQPARDMATTAAASARWRFIVTTDYPADLKEILT